MIMQIEELQKKLEELQKLIQEIQISLSEHNHTGIIGKEINLQNIMGLIRTITSASDLTNITGQPAKRIQEQFLIDTSTATKKLYVFDADGNVWRSVTIA